MIGIKSEALLLFRKFLTSKVPIVNTISSLSVSDNVDDVNTMDQIDEDKRRRNVNMFRKYFNSSKFNDKIDSLPFTLLRQRVSRPEHLYLLDEQVAAKFVDLIKDDLLEHPRRIVEVNAGVGVLTEKLLDAGIPKLSIFETQSRCVEVLAKLKSKYRNKIDVREADMFQMWKIAYQDRIDGGDRVAKLLSGFTEKRWGKSPGLQIIGALPSINFIRHLILDVVRQCGVVSGGRPCLYVFVPPSVWGVLTCDNTGPLASYRSVVVLFQLFFNYKLIGEFPRKAFLPWVPNYSAKKDKKAKDREYMCAVKIQGKENLFTEIIDESLIQHMWYFITHHMTSRSGRVIPQMESWSPGCGINLIMKDYNIYTQFGDLTPQQILDLFKDLTTWDAYHSSFIPSFENSTQKLEQLTF